MHFSKIKRDKNKRQHLFPTFLSLWRPRVILFFIFFSDHIHLRIKEKMLDWLMNSFWGGCLWIKRGRKEVILGFSLQTSYSSWGSPGSQEAGSPRLPSSWRHWAKLYLFLSIKSWTFIFLCHWKFFDNNFNGYILVHKTLRISLKSD